MGVHIFSSCRVHLTSDEHTPSDKHEPSGKRRKSLPNPNPSNYEITKAEQVGKSLVVKINYPDCTNYEGNKILLYRKTTLKQLAAHSKIDPHFCESCLSPFARFEPTYDGWHAALKLAKIMDEST